MPDLLPLVFNDENVRTLYLDEYGVLFLNHDVCHVLEYANPREMAANLDDDERVTVANTDGQGGPARVWLTESGVFTVIMRSNKPVAKAFRKEVLEYVKSISRHGIALHDVTAKEMAQILDAPVNATLIELLKTNARQMVQESRLAEVERKMAAIGDLDNSYTTIVGYFNRVGGTIDDVDAGIFGKKASKVCRQRGIEIGNVKHERWGTVQTYPESVIAEVYDWFKGRG